MPAYLWLAQAYTRNRQIPYWQYLLALFWCGACKETFFLTNTALAFLFLLRSPRKRIDGLILLSQGLIFIYLFCFWMPAHSMQNRYYALSFYADPGQELLPTVLAMLGNLWQEQSLTFLILAFLGGAWLAVIRPRLILMASLPGLATMLLSRHPQVKSVVNHYILTIIPFFWSAALQNREAFASVFGRLRAFLLHWGALASLAVTLLHSGVIENSILMSANQRSLAFRRDTEAFYKKHIHPDDLLLLDGILQPNIPQHPKSQNLIGFWGDPTRISDEQLASAFYVLTSEDFMKIEDCSNVEIAFGQRPIYYDDFARICEVIKLRGQSLGAYTDSRLHGYFIPAAFRSN